MRFYEPLQVGMRFVHRNGLLQHANVTMSAFDLASWCLTRGEIRCRPGRWGLLAGRIPPVLWVIPGIIREVQQFSRKWAPKQSWPQAPHRIWDREARVNPKGCPSPGETLLSFLKEASQNHLEALKATGTSGQSIGPILGYFGPC